MPAIHGRAARQTERASAARVERHMAAKRWGKAIQLLEEITATNPSDSSAWLQLAYSHHLNGDLRKALEVGEHSATFPRNRPTALYNMACAHSMLGELESAEQRLVEARSAGFADIDLIESDAELENLRSKVELESPPRLNYRELRGRNGVVLPYRVLLPPAFAAEREYSVAVFFAQGSGGARCTDWAADRYFGATSGHADWIVVFAVQPERGWLNHPAHHALEDLFKRLRKDYRVDSDRFHLVGLGNGAEVATTYSRMSARYVTSLTVVGASPFADWDGGDFRAVRNLPIHQVVGAQPEFLSQRARASHAQFAHHKVRARLSVLPDDGPLLESASSGKLIDLIRLVKSKSED